MMRRSLSLFSLIPYSSSLLITFTLKEVTLWLTLKRGFPKHSPLKFEFWLKEFKEFEDSTSLTNKTQICSGPKAIAHCFSKTKLQFPLWHPWWNTFLGKLKKSASSLSFHEKFRKPIVKESCNSERNTGVVSQKNGITNGIRFSHSSLSQVENSSLIRWLRVMFRSNNSLIRWFWVMFRSKKQRRRD